MNLASTILGLREVKNYLNDAIYSYHVGTHSQTVNGYPLAATHPEMVIDTLEVILDCTDMTDVMLTNLNKLEEGHIDADQFMDALEQELTALQSDYIKRDNHDFDATPANYAVAREIMETEIRSLQKQVDTLQAKLDLIETIDGSHIL